MRLLACAVVIFAASCAVNIDKSDEPASFDGADHKTQPQKLAHGKRLGQIFSCSGCHGEDHSGTNFGEMIPILKGLWATNISLTMPAMSDAELETLLRQGVHPSRDEIFLMPSKQTQFLSERDMSALIAYLRTIPPKGELTPPPPPGFRDAVGLVCQTTIGAGSQDFREPTIPLPKSLLTLLPIKLRQQEGVPSLPKASTLLLQRAPPFMEQPSTGAVKMPAGEGGAALSYNDAQFHRQLTQSISRKGRQLKMEWGFGREVFSLTEAHRSAVITYTRKLARRRVK